MSFCTLIFAASTAFHAINITSGNPDRVDFIASEINRQHRTLGIESFAPSMQFHVRPELDAVVERNVAVWRAIRDRVDPGVKLGFLIQSSLGGMLGSSLRGESGPPEGWQRTEFLTGKASTRTCILEPKFLAYMKRAVKAMARAKPAFILVDDDFSTRRNECCCPLHLELVSKALGGKIDKVRFRDILEKNAYSDAEYVKAVDAIYGAFENFAKELRASIDEVDPALRCGLCSGGNMISGLKRTALALAGPGTEPFVRFCNAVYGPQEPYTIVHSVAVAERMRAFVDPVKDILCEGDTCPHNAMSTPAVRFNASLANNALSGICGAKLWMSDFKHDRFVDNQRRYEKIYGEWEGFRLELLRLAREGIRWRGIASVVFDPALRIAPVKRDGGIDPWYEYSMMILSPYAMPIRFARPGEGGVFAVSAGEAKMLSKAEREELVKNPLILDPKCGEVFPERGEHTYVSEVSPSSPYYVRYSTVQREKFKAAVDRLLGGKLEMSLEVDQPAFVRHGVLGDDSEIVAVTMLSEDPLEELPLRLCREPKAVEALGKNGKWSPVAFRRTATDIVTVAHAARFYDPVALRFTFRETLSVKK